jgi:hypothetical protein
MKSLIEIANRHVRDGEEKVARQRAVVAQLEHDGEAARADLARALLITLETSLGLACDDLRRYEVSQRQTLDKERQ